MGKKKDTDIVHKVKETSDTLVVQAKRPLTETELEMLSNKLRFEHEATGIKIILLPYSVELKEDSEGDDNISEEVLAELEELRKFKQDAEQELEELRKLKQDPEETKKANTGADTKEGE